MRANLVIVIIGFSFLGCNNVDHSQKIEPKVNLEIAQKINSFVRNYKTLCPDKLNVANLEIDILSFVDSIRAPELFQGLTFIVKDTLTTNYGDPNFSGVVSLDLDTLKIAENIFLTSELISPLRRNSMDAIQIGSKYKVNFKEELFRRIAEKEIQGMKKMNFFKENNSVQNTLSVKCKNGNTLVNLGIFVGVIMKIEK